jgi:hypothetical protein
VSRKIPPPTPVKFPRCSPQRSTRKNLDSLVKFLREIQRPIDVKLEHLEALGLHVIHDAAPEDIIPDHDFLPPKEWVSIPPEDLEDINNSTTRPLNCERQSPGVKTYVERTKELSIPNAAAYRTVRRQPVPPGEQAVRLGNAYEFFKNLESFESYWDDTSVPLPENSSNGVDPMDIDSEKSSSDELSQQPGVYKHKYGRLNSGTSMPADIRVSLLISLTKLVAYDFGCNVSMPRTEPRLYVTSPALPPTRYDPCPSPQTSSFPSPVTFIYRTPVDRSAARSGVVEGPLAALSTRSTTGFVSTQEAVLDLARETVAALITAQQRARELQTERRPSIGKWWCTVPRWGGGAGGMIGREGERWERILREQEETRAAETHHSKAHTRRASQSIGSDGILASVEGGLPGSASADSSSNSPLSSSPASSISSTPKVNSHRSPGSLLPPKKKNTRQQTRDLPIYDAYRKLREPSSTWDKKARYQQIGKVAGAGYDDVFVLSSLNHHVSVLRVRVTDKLLSILGCDETAENGEDPAKSKSDFTEEGKNGIPEMLMYRSKWWDMFIVADRVEAMRCIWGMVAWMMRKVDDKGDLGDLKQTDTAIRGTGNGENRCGGASSTDVLMT